MVQSKADITLNRALRGDSGRFIWLFDLPDTSAVPSTAFHVRRNRLRRINARITLRFDADGCARQVAVDVPADCSAFTVVMKTPDHVFQCEVDKQRCEAETNAYYRRICNADADESYGAWFQSHQNDTTTQEVKTVDAVQPLFSVITPLFNTPPAFIDDLLGCMKAQTYENWEHLLINASPDNEELNRAVREGIGDDRRFRIINLPENLGIAENTNVGIHQARGDYLCFLDHDDILESDALRTYASAILADSEIDLLYCDEDNVDADGTNPHIPLFKPQASPDLLYSNCYVLHWLCVSRRIIEATARSSSRYDGAQDYDLILKSLESGAKMEHIPRVLYHWRLHEGSMSQNVEGKPYAQEAGRLAIADHLSRKGLNAIVDFGDLPSSYRTTFATPRDTRLSLIAPDAQTDILALPDREAFCGIDAVRLPACNQDTGFGQSLAKAAAEAQGNLSLVMLQNIDSPVAAFAGILAGYFQRDEVGIVMPRLFQPDGLLLSMGLSVDGKANLVPLMEDLPAWDGGFIDFAHRPRNVRATDCACFALRTTDLRRLCTDMPCYRSAAYTIADLCLQLQEEGKLCVYSPFAEAQIARGRADGWNINENDRVAFLARWSELLETSDPYTNPNLDATSPWFVLTHPEEPAN